MLLGDEGFRPPGSRASANVVDSGHLVNGRYRLRERLGHGGMSVVWRASDEVLGRDVAVKVLAAQLAADPDTLRRLHDEARAAAALRHPNVVEVYDYGEMTHQGQTLPYVVMELVNGRSLADLVTGGALPWKLAVVIGAQVAAALADAHARGVVHRDVKPANVMVTSAGAKLVDFGISAAVGAIDGEDGQVLGTPAYLAPERIAGGPVRPASDVYALGLLLYLTLSGHAPWPKSTVTQTLRAHLYAEPLPLPPVPGMPAVVARLVRRCLAKRPGDRPSAVELTARLGELAGLPPAKLLHVPETAEAGAPAMAAPTVARRRPLWAVVQAATPLVAARRAVAAVPATRRRAAVGAVTVLGVLLGGLIARTINDGGPGAPTAAAATPPPATSATGTRASAPPAPQACTVRYALRGTATGRAAAKVTILNTGEVPVPAWRLSFALPSGQRLIDGWSGTWRQDGRAVVAAGGALPAGGAAATGFSAAYGEVAALPVTFRLNGTTCRAEMSVQPAPAPARPAARPATRPAPPAAAQPEPAAPAKAKVKVKKDKKHEDDEDDGDDEGDEDD